MKGALTAALCACALMGVACGGEDDEPSPPPQPFTETAAKDALRTFFTVRDASAYCGYLLPYAERQVVAGLRYAENINARDCEAVIEMAYEDRPDNFGGLSRDEREALKIEVDLDRRTQTAAFLSEFRSGWVLRLVEGRWMVAGLATGG